VTAAAACRLCGGAIVPKFRRTVLGKHEVEFLECPACGSLQTEAPYWLDEAYAGANLAALDSGAAQRNLLNLASCGVVRNTLGLNDVLDVGGGDGLLCRLLRDYGVNCYVRDKYAVPTYARGFTQPDFEKPQLVLAFEVLEHFSNPQAELGALFDVSPDAVLVSTEIYRNQGAEWWYLAPESGQHVFFYSEKALGLIAKRYGYEVLRVGSYVVFARNLGPLQRWILKAGLRPLALRFLKAYFVQKHAPGVWRDHVEQRERSSRTDSTQ
jgi:hypothetical protein